MKLAQLSTLLAAALLTGCFSSSPDDGSTAAPEGYTLVPALKAPADQTILRFDITNIARGTVNRYDRTIKLYLPSSFDLTNLAPTISMKDGCTISPARGVGQDLSNPVAYTVTKGSVTTTYSVQAFSADVASGTVNSWLGRGINLGNDLDAWSASGPVANEEGSWTGGVVAKEYFFDDYKSLGFHSVRIPITWNRRLGTSSPYTVDSDFMTRVDTVAGWGIDRGLAVVINAHHEDWIRTKTDTAFAAALPRFKALWKQIAAHFKYWPPQLVFEILNEPHENITPGEVNQLNSEVLEIIRGSGGNNTTRAVIIGNTPWNGVGTLNDGTGFTVPNDSYLIANFHDYDPWSFAGQAQNTWGAQTDSDTMAGELDGAKAWAAAHDNIPLYMGEYGVTHRYTDPASHKMTKTDTASRLAWYTKITQLATARGISMAAWDDNGDFKLYDRASRAFETTIRHALFQN